MPKPDEVRLAVVIQLRAEANAGVMFTANPANGLRDQMVIRSFGEAAVSGTVTTDDLLVDAGMGSVVSRQTTDKEFD